MSSTAHRQTHLETIFGSEILKTIKSANILVVGAGGIGCELLKNLVCTGFGHITIIDLDTIDTSNLNRQFLFQTRHVKRPKAIVARETASAFNPAVSITALQANILEPTYSADFFSSFDLVLNALDNLTARRHVNKICVAARVPLVESGTAGYTGQVQPIINRSVECYDCQPKPVAKSFPVCTIRSTPSTPIHCIVWAKSFLFGWLFGPEEDSDGAELDEALKNGESMEELKNLRVENTEMKEIRKGLDKSEAVERVFEKIFAKDIHRLLAMKTMWTHRTPPTPLSFQTLKTALEKRAPEASPAPTAGLLKDQQTLDLNGSFALFCSSLTALGSRIESDPSKEPLTWDKDDSEALDFVTAAANLRASVFGIPLKTRFEVKEMAGNIIPAIATTNSAVSALIVFQAIQILTQTPLIKSTRPWYAKSSERIILPADLDPPNPSCAVCGVVYASATVCKSTTLGEFLEQAVGDRFGDLEGIMVQEGDRLILDPDFRDNEEKSLVELELVGQGKLVSVTDEDEVFVPVIFILKWLAIISFLTSGSGNKHWRMLIRVFIFLCSAEERQEEDGIKKKKILAIDGLPDSIPKRPAKPEEPKEDDEEDDGEIEMIAKPGLLKRPEAEVEKGVSEEEEARVRKKRKLEQEGEKDGVVVIY
ncbi:hypothetical protein CROQUDRAFT_51885 [Cronartium quercuum f. sp. fusiforme G11]|uniref:Ubiquitin-activating enzyme E1-like n=1 Tax=Cronartium quercuum f. sp. fusiforme G11 TaxID=708437 RepID=A0A9P6N8L6_9BASI|nr:hypothetical protein CROQUDRAFT_51885 [Cronartium quercuum f. sp. fusiforme G11]